MAYSIHKRKQRRNKLTPLLAILPVALLSVAVFLYYRSPIADNPTPNQPEAIVNTPEKPVYESISLQSTVEEWVVHQSAEYSIQIYDLQNGEIIGSNNPKEVIFAASLYKIYVAYLSLIDFQDGIQKPDDILINGYTKMECVDAMIRSSDSACGEAMMAEIGQLNLNKRVQDLGMSDTAFNGITTTAADSALIIKKIDDGNELTPQNTELLLDAMLNQDIKYKRGLQTGANQATWHTKVGWNLDINYHDIGMMTLPDGRKFAIAILGQGSGSPSPIADFAKTIYAKLTTGY